LADHIVVVAKGRLSRDQRRRQNLATRSLLYPTDSKSVASAPNYAWDPINNIFYASSMGKEALKYQR